MNLAKEDIPSVFYKEVNYFTILLNLAMIYTPITKLDRFPPLSFTMLLVLQLIRYSFESLFFSHT